MGRAQQLADRSNAFTAVMGPGRGRSGAGLVAARQALSGGDCGPALQAVDEGVSERDPELVELLAVRLAKAGAGDVEAAVAAAMTRANLLRMMSRYAIPIPVPVFEHETFLIAAADAVQHALESGAGTRRGVAALRGDCEAALGAEAYRGAAAYLRAGGAANLRVYFGESNYSVLRGFVRARTSTSLTDRAAATLTVKAVSAEWVQCVCENPNCYQNPLRQAAELADIAGRIFRSQQLI